MSPDRKTLFLPNRKTFSGLILIFLLILSFTAAGQDKKNTAPPPPPRPKKLVRLSVGGTLIRTHFRRNYTDDFTSATYEGRLYIYGNEYIRGVINVENQPPLDIKPEWRQTHSLLFDFLGNFTGYFGDRGSCLYGMFGPSYQKFSGIFTGYGYIPQLQPYIGKTYNANYWGGLLGLGVEFRLVKNIFVYAEGRIRFLFEDEKKVRSSHWDLSVYDQLCVGLKIALPEFQMRKIFRNPNDKYHWF